MKKFLIFVCLVGFFTSNFAAAEIIDIRNEEKNFLPLDFLQQFCDFNCAFIPKKFPSQRGFAGCGECDDSFLGKSLDGYWNYQKYRKDRRR